MELKQTLLNKIILVLFGIFLTSTIFALTLKAFNETGIYIGLLIAIIVVFLGFYYTQPKTRLRLISWSILITLILGTLGFIIGMQILSKSLEGI